MTDLNETHDPDATSWVDGADGHAEFPVQNLPLGIFSQGDGGRRGRPRVGRTIARRCQSAA